MPYSKHSGEHRKRKLLEKKQYGKKRMKRIGKINILPRRRQGLACEAF